VQISNVIRVQRIKLLLQVIKYHYTAVEKLQKNRTNYQQKCKKSIAQKVASSVFLPNTQEKSLHHQQDNAAIWVKVETNTNNLVKL